MPSDSHRKLRAGRVGVTNHLAGIHYRNLMQYRLRPYDGRVVLFMPRYDPADVQRGTLDEWRASLR